MAHRTTCTVLHMPDFIQRTTHWSTNTGFLIPDCIPDYIQCTSYIGYLRQITYIEPDYIQRISYIWICTSDYVQRLQRIGLHTLDCYIQENNIRNDRRLTFNLPRAEHRSCASQHLVMTKIIYRANCDCALSQCALIKAQLRHRTS